MNDMSIVPGYSVDDTLTRYSQNDISTAIPVFLFTSPVSALGLIRCDSYHQVQKRINDKTVIMHDSVAAGLQAYFDNEGGPCYVLSFTAEQAASAEMETFLQPILENPEITLLAMPDNIVKWQLVMPVVTARRPDIFCLIDPPQDREGARAFTKTFSTEELTLWGDSAAAYWPWLKCEYRVSSQYALIPPSFVMAAVIARTDHIEGIWKAPANVELAHVLSPDPDAGGPLPAGSAEVNVMTSLPGMGPRIWGCRTFMPAHLSRVHYVQVRRLLTYIERNLADLGRFMLFEPNNAMTWFKYKGVANDWLRSLWQTGGLAGQNEEEAWSVQLGVGESMTEQDVSDGKIRIAVRVKPTDVTEQLSVHLNLTLQEAGTGAAPASQL